MKITRLLSSGALAIVAVASWGQAGANAPKPAGGKTQAQIDAEAKAKAEALQLANERDAQQKKWDLMRQQEVSGTRVRLKDIAHFRGVWANQLSGMGIVAGLDGTGDSKKFTATSEGFANLLRRAGLDVQQGGIESKNLALVVVTATLPPFATPGQTIDVTISTVGDAKSLRGGTLMFTPLKYPTGDKVFATAAGAISVGGFTAQSGGASQSKGFVTVGKIPSGAIVQEGVATATVFDGKMFIDLDDQDATTAHRVEQQINGTLPEFRAVALNGGSVQITLPAGLSATAAQAKLEEISVMADTEAKVVVNERTGTIVVGGNVRIGPCAFAKGSLSVKIEQDLTVSQPAPLSNGQTVAVSNKTVTAGEEDAQIALLRPNTTVADLAAILQSLKLKASDIIDILQSLRTQGALKAKVIVE